MASGVDSLINQLYEMIQDAWTVPLSSEKCVIMRDKALDLLDEINNQLPTELKKAQEIIARKDEYEQSAKAGAEQILQKASEQAKKMVSEQEIVAAAKVKAAEIMAAADAKAKDVLRVSREYVDESLSQAEQVVTGALNDIRQARARFKGAAPQDK